VRTHLLLVSVFSRKWVMKILVVYNMHVNETETTEPVAETLKSKGYDVEKLAGYVKREYVDQMSEFLSSLNEVKEKGKTFDLIVDLHATLWILRPYPQPVPWKRAIPPPCIIATYNERLYEKIKEMVKGLWSHEWFLSRLWKRSWTKVILDRNTAPSIEDIRLSTKYIEVEIDDYSVAREVLTKLLKQMEQEL